MASTTNMRLLEITNQSLQRTFGLAKYFFTKASNTSYGERYIARWKQLCFQTQSNTVDVRRSTWMKQFCSSVANWMTLLEIMAPEVSLRSARQRTKSPILKFIVAQIFRRHFRFCQTKSLITAENCRRSS